MIEQQKAMQGAPLLEEAPAYRPAIDLTTCYKAPRQFGSVLVWYTWIRLMDEWQACLVLTPATALVSVERCTPCVVPLATAFKWAEETGDFQECLITAGHFCANLGFNPFNRKNPFKIISIIRENLHDLLTIPPRAEWAADRVITAEMDVIDNTTGKVTEMEVSDDYGAV